MSARCRKIKIVFETLGDEHKNGKRQKQHWIEANNPDDPTLQNADDVVLREPIYISNDPDSGLFLKVAVPRDNNNKGKNKAKGITRRELAR